MIIYYSMIGWIAIIYLLTNSTTHRLDAHRNKPVPMMVAFIVFGYIVFWAGIRTRFGDTYTYILGYNKVSTSLSDMFSQKIWDSKAPLYSAFQIVIKCIAPDNPQVFLMLIAIIQGIPIALTLRRYSENFFYSAFLFIVSMSLFWMLNGIRQFIAVAILFGCTPLMVERKWKSYTAVVLLMSLVHFSALIMIPIYWFATSKPWKMRSILFVIVTIGFAIFAESFADLLDATLAETHYADVTDQFEADDGVHPLRLVVSLVPVIISFLVKSETEKVNDPFVDIMVNMSIMTAGLFLVGMRTSGILIGRLPIYTSMYSLIQLPYLFNHYFERKSRKMMYVLCTIGYLVFFYLLTKGYAYRSNLTGQL